MLRGSPIRSLEIEKLIESCCRCKWPARRVAQAIFDQTGERISLSTVGHWMTRYRAQQEETRQTEIAQQERVREFEAIGRGLGSVHIGTAGAAEILQAAAPDFHQKQAAMLRDLFQQYLERPTPNLLCGLSVGLHAFLLSEVLTESLRERDA
ncbi:MAG: hypothetical protein P4L56_20305 [Candidatus Sulfopaludibacter sp.]|nr:hypothetical protein [Candidatus Sulfopaludibacter sp.]